MSKRMRVDATAKLTELTHISEASSSRARRVQFGCTGPRQSIPCSTITSSRMPQMSSWAPYNTKRPISSLIRTRRSRSSQTRLTRTLRSPTAPRITVRRPGVFASSTAPTSSSMVRVCTVSSRIGVRPTVLLPETVSSIWWIFRTRVIFICGP